jgi:hypothetical protein
MLQKSAATDWAFGPFVKSRGFDAPALTLFTQLQRYAIEGYDSGAVDTFKSRSIRPFFVRR